MNTQIRAEWYVSTSNFLPSRYCLHFSTAHTTARYSFSAVEYDVAKRKQERSEAKALTCSAPPKSYVNAAPNPISLASVYTLKSLVKSGGIKTGAHCRAYLRSEAF